MCIKCVSLTLILKSYETKFYAIIKKNTLREFNSQFFLVLFCDQRDERKWAMLFFYKYTNNNNVKFTDYSIFLFYIQKKLKNVCVCFFL